MSTRSLIAMSTDEGIRAIYCHHDGYIDGVGVTLHEHYKDRAKVTKLIENGDTSSLEAELADCKFYFDEGSKPASYVDYQDLLTELDGNIEYVYLFLKNDIWAVVEYKSMGTIGVQELSDPVAKIKRSQMRSV